MSEDSATDNPATLEAATRPLLRVVKGDLTPEELAALIAVVAARNSGAAAPQRKPRSEWGHPARQMRGWHRQGHDAWHRTAFGG